MPGHEAPPCAFANSGPRKTFHLPRPERRRDPGKNFNVQRGMSCAAEGGLAILTSYVPTTNIVWGH
jgi:hypothetical protein